MHYPRKMSFIEPIFLVYLKILCVNLEINIFPGILRGIVSSLYIASLTGVYLYWTEIFQKSHNELGNSC